MIDKNVYSSFIVSKYFHRHLNDDPHISLSSPSFSRLLAYLRLVSSKVLFSHMVSETVSMEIDQMEGPEFSPMVLSKSYLFSNIFLKHSFLLPC